MVNRVRIDLDRTGLRAAALTSPEVRAQVRATAERMAARARGITDDPIVVSDSGNSRARAYVARLGSGAAGESEDRALGRSIGGA